MMFAALIHVQGEDEDYDLDYYYYYSYDIGSYVEYDYYTSRE